MGRSGRRIPKWDRALPSQAAQHPPLPCSPAQPTLGSPNPQLPGVCVCMCVLQLGTHSPVPYLARKKGRWLGFWLCRTLPSHPGAPQAMAGARGGPGVFPSSSRVSHRLQPSLENLGGFLQAGLSAPTASRESLGPQPIRCPPGWGCLAGRASPPASPSALRQHSMPWGPTPRTEWGKEGASFWGVDTVAFPPRGLQGLQMGGLHAPLPATFPGTLPALPERWATLRLAFHHSGKARADRPSVPSAALGPLPPAWDLSGVPAVPGGVRPHCPHLAPAAPSELARLRAVPLRCRR